MISSKKIIYGSFIALTGIILTTVFLGLSNDLSSKNIDNIDNIQITQNQNSTNITTSNTTISQNKTVFSTLKDKITNARKSFEENNNTSIYDIENVSLEKYQIILTELIHKYGGIEFKKELEEIGKFHIEDNAPNSKIVKDISLAQLDKKNVLLALITFAEGYSKKAYPDNLGVATGTGYNISMQSKGFNNQMFSSLNMSKAVIISQKMSGKTNYSSFSQEDITTVSLSPQRAVQTSTIMAKSYEKELYALLGQFADKNTHYKKIRIHEKLSLEELGKRVLDALETNEQAVIKYQPYKTGIAGFSKYNKLLTNLIEYSYKKTPELKKAVAQSFTYNYKLGNEVKQDYRATAIITATWFGAENLKEIIEKAGVYPDKVRKVLNTVHKGLINENGNVDSSVYDAKQKGIGIQFQGDISKKAIGFGFGF